MAIHGNQSVSEICETSSKPVILVFHFVAVDQYGNDNDDDGNSNDGYADTDGDCDYSDCNVSCNKHIIMAVYCRNTEEYKINKISYVLRCLSYPFVGLIDHIKCHCWM